MKLEIKCKHCKSKNFRREGNRKTKNRGEIQKYFYYKVSHVSILDWVRRYTLKVHQFIESQGYNLGNSFYADETMINREGKLDRFWCCLDWIQD